jgi:hypothetical protein
MFASADTAATAVAELIVTAPANCCITLEAGLRLSAAGSGLEQLNNTVGFICLALHITVGSGSNARKALDAAAESAPCELFALITTMIKALGAAAAAAPAAAAADGAAAAEVAAAAATPGLAMLLILSGTLLQMCSELPQQLSLQQRLVLLGRCMSMTGQVIAHAFAAPAPDAGPAPAVQLLLLSATRPTFSATPDFVQRKMRQLLGASASAITILSAGMNEVALPGAAAGTAAAAEVCRQVDEQLLGLTRCVLCLANVPVSAESEKEDESESYDEEYEDTDSDSDQEEEAEHTANTRQQSESSSSSSSSGEPVVPPDATAAESSLNASAATDAGASSGAGTAGASVREGTAGAGTTADAAGAEQREVGAAEMQEIAQQILSLELGERLQQVGTSLVVQLPQPLWCCNPSCSSLVKLSELALVGGKGCVCSSCRTARFCSRECLTACWTNALHKRVCRRIAAASSVPARPVAAAAAAPAPAPAAAPAAAES